MTELLGREKSERRKDVDAALGYRNGHGKPRHLTLSSGTITVRGPRVRGLEGRFESRVLPLFKRHTKEVTELLPQLYLHGLARGDFDLALRGLLGEAAPLSSTTIGRLKVAGRMGSVGSPTAGRSRGRLPLGVRRNPDKLRSFVLASDLPSAPWQ